MTELTNEEHARVVAELILLKQENKFLKEMLVTRDAVVEAGMGAGAFERLMALQVHLARKGFRWGDKHWMGMNPMDLEALSVAYPAGKGGKEYYRFAGPAGEVDLIPEPDLPLGCFIDLRQPIQVDPRANQVFRTMGKHGRASTLLIYKLEPMQSPEMEIP